MNRLIPLALTLLALYLAGCTVTYSRPGLTQAEFDADSFECQYMSQSLPRTPQSTTRGPTGLIHYSDPTLGWGDVARSQRMMDSCMRARGYTRE